MWYLLVLPAFSAWIAMLESDTVMIGQWTLSRPMLVGPLVGLICGELWIGLVLGVLVELFWLESLPVGAVMPFNGAVAAGCAVLLSAGREPVAIAAAFPAGLALGWAHRWLEGRLRQSRWTLTGEAAGAQRHSDGNKKWPAVKDCRPLAWGSMANIVRRHWPGRQFRLW